MPDLSGFKDFATDDGEDFWVVNVAHALDAIVGEMESWGNALVINSSTGEIFDGPLYTLMDRIGEAVKLGQRISVEPATYAPRSPAPRSPFEDPQSPILRVVAVSRNRQVVDGTFIPGLEETVTLTLENSSTVTWVNESIPSYIRIDEDGEVVGFYPMPNLRT